MKKFFLITAIVVLVIIIIGVVYVYTNKDKIINYAVDKSITVMESKVIASLPDSSVQDSVKTLFNKAQLGIKDGTIDKNNFQGLFLYFQNATKDKVLDSLEVNEFIGKLNGLVVQDNKQ